MGVYSEGKEIIKDIISLSKGINDMELKNKILELQTTFYDLNDENRELRFRIEELQNIDHIGNKIEVRGDHYYLNDDGPYCTNCWDSESKLIRILDSPRPMRNFGRYRCPKCETLTN